MARIGEIFSSSSPHGAVTQTANNNFAAAASLKRNEMWQKMPSVPLLLCSLCAAFQKIYVLFEVRYYYNVGW